jgi:methyltransferase
MIERYFATVKFPREAMKMRIFHTLWFFSLIFETYIHGQLVSGLIFYVCLIILILAQALRWYAIYTLGPYWSVDIYQVKMHPIVKKGPYAYFRHPNYFAVMLEFLVLPYSLGCPVTLIWGSIINYFILQKRIKLEELALSTQSNDSYQQQVPFWYKKSKRVKNIELIG